MIYLSQVLDVMCTISWLDNWIAAIKRKSGLRVVRNIISGNIVDRGLTFKDLEHKQPLTDMFLAGSLLRVNRSRTLQVTGRMFGCMKPDEGELFLFVKIHELSFQKTLMSTLLLLDFVVCFAILGSNERNAEGMQCLKARPNCM